MKKTVKSALLFSTVVLGLVSITAIETTSPQLSITAYADSSDNNTMPPSIAQMTEIIKNMSPNAQAILADYLLYYGFFVSSYSPMYNRNNKNYDSAQDALLDMVSNPNIYQDILGETGLSITNPNADGVTSAFQNPFKINTITSNDLKDVFKVLNISKLQSLQIFNVSLNHDNNDSPLSVIKSANKLTSLFVYETNLSDNDVQSIPLNSLSKLSLIATNVRSIDFLKNNAAKNLNMLALSRNNIEDLSPAANYKLTEIFANKNMVDSSFNTQTITKNVNLSDPNEATLVGDNYKIPLNNLKDINFSVTYDSKNNPSLTPKIDGTHHLYSIIDSSVNPSVISYGYDDNPSLIPDGYLLDGSATNGVSYIEVPKSNFPSSFTFTVQSTQSLNPKETDNTKTSAVDYTYTINLTKQDVNTTTTGSNAGTTSSNSGSTTTTTNINSNSGSTSTGSNSGTTTTTTSSTPTTTGSNTGTSTSTNTTTPNTNVSKPSNNDSNKQTDVPSSAKKLVALKDFKVYKTLKSGKKVAQVIKKSSVVHVLKKVHKGKKTLYLVEYFDSKTKKNVKGYISASSKNVGSLYYTKNVEKVKVLKRLTSYKKAGLKSPSKKYAKGEVLKVKAVKKHGDTYYLELSNGKFITASKQDVEVVK